MLNRLFLASLVSIAACSGSTAAAPSRTSVRPPLPPPAKACAANGTAVLQIDTVPNEQLSPKPVAKERFTLTDTGAWTYKAHQLKIARSYAGCLGAAELASLRSKMARVPWTLTHLDVTCAAIPTTFTTYTVEGKARYTQAMCSGDTLDAASQQVVGEINTLVGKLIAPHAATGK